MTALLDLYDAVTQLARDGQHVPCRGDQRFVADDRATRAEAALDCRDCPVLDECREAGRSERFGVWGGRDRTPAPSGERGGL